ncbi:hypothetical protein QBC34DRAFT_451772 [Podospora aff. communis PSN243]|uniref:Uncharacterized protein n=1 Tax=Podospora aff. communis PSN243 TaxID=3040156 RepID=A0AAV9G9V7_9PEZI|nr:hypothetical protein QBC34DRAFT_451772 [Podospora aff. communis PSN243]
MSLPDPDPCPTDPYWIHVHVLGHFAAHQDIAVWGIRELVRSREKTRPSINAPNPNYQQDHDIARHAIHGLRDSRTINHNRQPYDQDAQGLYTTPSSRSSNRPGLAHRHIDKKLSFLEYTMQSLNVRSTSNRDRLLNEVQLAFNVVRAAQYDSYSMRTIAFLTLAFLPATFISALFSMSFFDFDAEPASWSVSGKIWIYFAIAGPVTLLTISTWIVWQKLLPPDVVTGWRTRNPVDRWKEDHTSAILSDSIAFK